MPPVGNDIVDLAAPGNPGKSGDIRFCSRVFTSEEQALIRSSDNPDTVLWALWAAKEAAFKAVRRGHRAVCSIPRQYHVTLPDKTVPGRKAGISGTVITPVGELVLQMEWNSDWVHALATESKKNLSGLHQRVEPVEGSEGNADPSAFVRKILQRDMSRLLGCAADDLSVFRDPEGSGIPCVLLHGRPLDAEISLSHDGRYAAFAFDPTALVPARQIES